MPNTFAAAAPDSGADVDRSEATGCAAVHPWIHPVPALDSNYIWMIAAPESPAVIVVDPGDAEPVVRWLQAREAGGTPSQPTAILLTHHHGDHTGGVQALRQRWPGIVVYGPQGGRYAGIDRGVTGGDRVQLPELQPGTAAPMADIMTTPGHTLDHIVWRFDRIGPDPRPVLFCGDALFAAGCGRLFEGTPEQLAQSMDSLSALSPQTLLYCAHEYALANLAYALAVEPDNGALQRRARAAQRLRERGVETVPTTLALELATNPYLRAGQPAVQRFAAAVAGAPPDPGAAAVLGALRKGKDGFSGSLPALS